MKSIKKELDCLEKFSDDVLENLDPQKCHYKEELDLEWDEKDNNYDENYDDFVKKPIEEGKEKRDDQNPSIMQKHHSQCTEISIDEDDVLENLDPQKYHYKEELDLDWDEKDNNYDENNDDFVKKPIEEGKEKRDEQNPSIFQKHHSQSTEISIEIEQLQNETDKINQDFTLQKYHYQEQLHIDCDKKDENYDESSIEKLIEKRKARTVEKNKFVSILQKRTYPTRKRYVKIENPDTEKNCPKCSKRLKNLNTLNKHLFYCGKASHLQCDSCSYKAKYKNTLIVHIMRNHPKQIQNLRENETTKKAKSKSNKIINEEQQNDKCFRFCANCHVRTDKPALNTCNKCECWLLYQCKKCYQTLRTRVDFNRHVDNICDPKGYYHCPACDYKSTFKDHVKTHLKSHLLPGLHLDIEAIKWKKVETKNTVHHVYTCPSCGKQHQRLASLSGHMRFCVISQGVSKPPTDHVKNQKRKKGLHYMLSRHCAKCNSKIQSNKVRTSNCCGSSILLKCLKCKASSEHHEGIKHDATKICSKTKCDMCDYEGSEKSVAAHRRHKHDFNSVECPKCKVKLQNKSHLQKHSYHCGKESLKCDYCAFISKVGSILRAHILQKHP